MFNLGQTQRKPATPAPAASFEIKYVYQNKRGLPIPLSAI